MESRQRTDRNTTSAAPRSITVWVSPRVMRGLASVARSEGITRHGVAVRALTHAARRDERLAAAVRALREAAR